MPNTPARSSMPPPLPQQLNPSSKESDFVLRGIAFFLDHFLFTLIAVASSFGLMSGSLFDEESSTGSLASLLGVGLVVFSLYFLKDAIRGRSVGKWILNLQVRDMDNQEEVPSLGRLVLRNVLILAWPIELISLLTSSPRRKLGDKWAKTTVVKTKDTASLTTKVILTASVGIALFATTFLFGFSMIKNNDAYRAAIVEIEQTQAIIDKTGGITGFGALPSGNIETKNGEGKATFTITVQGVTKDISVKAHLSKDPDTEWTVHKLKYK